MTAAEKLRGEGLAKPDFTRDEFIAEVERQMRERDGRAGFIIGRHVGTKFNQGISGSIGDCNPYNRKCAEKWLTEEGFHFHSTFNKWGVESLHITL